MDTQRFDGMRSSSPGLSDDILRGQTQYGSLEGMAGVRIAPDGFKCFDCLCALDVGPDVRGLRKKRLQNEPLTRLPSIEGVGIKACQTLKVLHTLIGLKMDW